MNIVQNNQLTFHNTTFAHMEMGGQIWLTASEIGQALEYADDKAIHRLYRKHADEFTNNMTGVVKVTTPGGMQDVRMFSLRGSHLIGMFARTSKAKEFRRWVLDILDREVAHSPIAKQFDEDLNVTLKWWYEHNFPMRVGNLPKPKRMYQTPSLNLTPDMMYGHDAQSPTLHLVSILEDMGFDLSGPRSEVAVMRKMLQKMYPEIRQIDAIRNMSKSRNVYVRGGKGEVLVS
ncbi:TPA: Bro-N domain-containing protein [Serratia fonticola]